MKQDTLLINDDSLLLSRLLGHVFHLTTRMSYYGILKAGCILNNKSAIFSINTSSENSFGRLNGLVCLFDFRDNNPVIIQNTIDRYNFLGPPWFASHSSESIFFDLAYLFLDPQYYDQIVPHKNFREYRNNSGISLKAIPDSEVWIKGSIPVSWIKRTLLVKIEKIKV